MALDPTGTDWTADEQNLIVADYFQMLETELAGHEYSKTKYRNALMLIVKRTKGSIEFKHQNISAVLQELGLPWIKGYKPASNYQGALLTAIEGYLANRHEFIVPPAKPILTHVGNIFVDPPSAKPAEPKTRELERLVRRFDPAARDARNRQLGKAGEEFVFTLERQRLQQAGHGHLAERVRWVSQQDGDGAGYDIHSFDPTGADRLLEVKTTCGAERTPFYLSRNELALSDERPNEFRLVRLHQFANDPKIFVLAPPLSGHLTLEPVNYRAHWA